MGFGNSIVVRNSPSNAEVVRDAGFLFDRNNPVESLSKRLADLISTPDVVESDRIRCQERVRETYSWEIATNKYISISD